MSVALLLPVIATGLWVLLTDRISRTCSYAELCVNWQKSWPLERGKYLPTRLDPLLSALNIVRPVMVEVEPGVRLVLNPADVVDMQVLATGYWERQVWDWVAPHLSPGGSFIDVGAHIGTFTIRAAKIVGKTGRVVAIEPNPNTADLLKFNVAASGWDDVVHVQQSACADEPGRLRLFVGSRINTGIASLSRQNVVEHGASGEAYFEVEVLTLDQIVESVGLSRIDVVKIDTEGAETKVLIGARNSIRKFRPPVVLETIDSQLRNMGSSLVELEAVLRDFGYVKKRQGPNDAEWAPAGVNP